MAPPNPKILESFDTEDERDRAKATAPGGGPSDTGSSREFVTELVISSDEPLVDSKRGKLQPIRYAFNQFEMPPQRKSKEGEQSMLEKRISDATAHVSNVERKFLRFMTKATVLLSRSSGRDKLAAFMQYGSMFYGHQPLLSVNSDAAAPWRKLEDAMSSGRKLFRLFKWVKEYEKARIALTVPGEFLGILRTRVRIMMTRVLTVLMHSWAGIYFFIDNVIWAAQMGLINRAAQGQELKEMFKRKLSYEKYLEFQEEYAQALQVQDAARERIEKWKDWKNNASLCRLILAILHSVIQIDSLTIERARLVQVFTKRVAKANANEESVSGLEAERDRRVNEVDVALFAQKRQMLHAGSNLCILLSRLKYRLFREIPLWGIGILGMIAACCGLHKNWPQEAPKPKQSKVIKSRADSIAKNDGSDTDSADATA